MRRRLWLDVLIGLGIGLAAWTCLGLAIVGLGWVRLPALRPSAVGQLIFDGTPPSEPAARPTAQPTATPFPRRTVQAPGGAITVVDHLILARPVAPNAQGNAPDWFYLYGNTERGKLAVHHGVEFVNPEGTPIQAVGDGTVVVAGGDQQPACGEGGNELCGAEPDFYGNLVVLQLDQPVDGQPLYALYGHMRDVEVQVGQHVETGDRLGTIGMTGVALGPHVHLEVRLGVNSYAATRNPILWLKPLSGRGALAGRVVDDKGQPVRGAIVLIDPADGRSIFSNPEIYTETYGVDDQPPVNPDDDMRENFAVADLPVGEYNLSVKLRGSTYQTSVTIADGELAYVVLGAAAAQP